MHACVQTNMIWCLLFCVFFLLLFGWKVLSVKEFCSQASVQESNHTFAVTILSFSCGCCDEIQILFRIYFIKPSQSSAFSWLVFLGVAFSWPVFLEFFFFSFCSFLFATILSGSERRTWDASLQWWQFKNYQVNSPLCWVMIKIDKILCSMGDSYGLLQHHQHLRKLSWMAISVFDLKVFKKIVYLLVFHKHLDILIMAGQLAIFSFTGHAIINGSLVLKTVFEN